MTESGELMPLATRQIGEASAMLGRAFHDDPLWQHVFPCAAVRSRRLPLLIAPVVQYAHRYGRVYTNRSVSGLAAWLGPRDTTMTIGRMIRAGMAAVPLRIGLSALRRLVAFQEYADALHARAVSGTHWYLLILGVQPTRQGKGIGSRLIQPVLAQADAEDLPCYLETLNARSVRFYQKHGFNVVAESTISGSGLRIWSLLRPAHNSLLSNSP